ncbi:MAG: hypothetical protein ABL932_25250, partial [Terricaulis sp.]
GDELTIVRDGERVALVYGPNRFRLYAETPTLFFMREDNVTFEFQTADGGAASSLVQTQAGETFTYRRVMP